MADWREPSRVAQRDERRAADWVDLKADLRADRWDAQ